MYDNEGEKDFQKASVAEQMEFYYHGSIYFFQTFFPFYLHAPLRASIYYFLCDGK